MKMLCMSQNKAYYIFSPESKDLPNVGSYYNLEDATHGTGAQNRAFHALIQEFYKWMSRQDNYVIESSSSIVFDFRCTDWLNLKDIFKARYGAGASHVNYVDTNYSIVKVPLKIKTNKGKTITRTLSEAMEEIPIEVINDFNNGNHGRIKQVLKSWSDYTKTDRKKLLDNTINIMKSCGVDSKKFHEILEGMEEDK